MAAFTVKPAGTNTSVWRSHLCHLSYGNVYTLDAGEVCVCSFVRMAIVGAAQYVRMRRGSVEVDGLYSSSDN